MFGNFRDCVGQQEPDGNAKVAFLGGASQIRDVVRGGRAFEHAPGDAELLGGLLATRVGEVIEVLIAQASGIGDACDQQVVLGSHRSELRYRREGDSGG